MTVIATASNPRFWVSRVDVDREGPTYTIDTLRDLRKELPDADLYFITGADALTDILTWRDADELFELAHFVGCTRPGYPMDRSSLSGMPEDKITLIEIPALAISSSDCRDRRMKGEPVWYLVPDGVVQYITKYALYVSDPDRHSTACYPGTPLQRCQPRMTATERALELVRTAAQAASDKLAENIVAFDVSEQLVITDAFVLCSAPNDRQVRASSTRSRTSCAPSTPSRYAARASATAAGCCSTTPRSSCTSSTRRSAPSTRWSGSGVTAR